jgi:hypothetical protein
MLPVIGEKTSAVRMKATVAGQQISAPRFIPMPTQTSSTAPTPTALDISLNPPAPATPAPVPKTQPRGYFNQPQVEDIKIAADILAAA